MNDNPKSLEFYYDDNTDTIIIGNQKIASAFLSNNINESYHVSLDLNPNGSVIYYREKADEFTIHQKKIIKRWESYVSKEKLRPTVIVLYREPYNRFVTAFIQDFIHIKWDLINSNIPIYHAFLETWYSDFGLNGDFIDDFFSQLPNIAIGKFKSDEKLIQYVFESYIKLMLRWKMNPSNVYKGHNNIHNSIISELLNNKVLSTNETKFYNLDNNKQIPLDIFLNNSGVDTKFREIESNNKWKKVVNEIIEKNNLKPIILKLIDEEIKSFKSIEISNTKYI